MCVFSGSVWSKPVSLNGSINILNSGECLTIKHWDFMGVPMGFQAISGDISKPGLHLLAAQVRRPEAQRSSESSEPHGAGQQATPEPMQGEPRGDVPGHEWIM